MRQRWRWRGECVGGEEGEVKDASEVERWRMRQRWRGEE